MAGTPMNVVFLTAVVAVLLLNHSVVTSEKGTEHPRAEQHDEEAKMASWITRAPMAVFTGGMMEGSKSPLVEADLSAQIDSIERFLVEEAGVSNYAVSVVRDGQTAFTSGLVTTPFFIHNSISDIFTSSAILGRLGMLRRFGPMAAGPLETEFSRDDPVEKFLPNFHLLAPQYSPDITLRQLMEDVSGASREIRQNDVQDHHKDDRTLLVNGAIEEWRSAVLKVRAKWLEMEKKFTGTDSEINLEPRLERPPFPALEIAGLSQALARISTEASIPPQVWQNFVEEEFLKHEGMTDSGTDLGRVFSEPGPDFQITLLQSAGHWYSTALDLAKCLVHLLSFDRRFRQYTDSTHDLTVEWAPLQANGSGLGLKWEHEVMNFGGKNEYVATNGGIVSDFGSFIGLHPRTKLGVCVLLCASESTRLTPNDLGSQILKTLILPLTNVVDSYYPGSYTCQPAPPLVRDFPHWSKTGYGDTVEVLGGEVNVTSSPSLGLQASLSISAMVSGKPQHRLGQFLMVTWGRREAPSATWTLVDPSKSRDAKLSLAGLTFQLEQWDGSVIEKVHEPTPGLVRCKRQHE